MEAKNLNDFKKSFVLSININFRYFIIFFFIFLFCNIHGQFEINLTIKGTGNQNIINSGFYLEPSEILVEGEAKPSCKKSCTFQKDINQVTIKFDRLIESCESMFDGLTNIKEIDLSNLDTSKVINMSSMFNDCTNLEKIIFGNINTSSVQNMFQLFHNCIKLTSIDVSNFDTSNVISMESIFSHCESIMSINVSNFNVKKVENMKDMFGYCYKLTSINVSNFDTPNLINMQGLFFYCFSLKSVDLSNFNTSSLINALYIFDTASSMIYINLYSFKINKDVPILDIFCNPSPYLKICVNDLETKKILQTQVEIPIDCNDICFRENINIDLNQNRCVEYCNESEYKYEYNHFCYNECPDKTYTIDNEYLCLDEKPEGYYFDSNNSVFKKCFESCKTCYGEGNEVNNNCIECLYNYFYTLEKNNSKNCYESCPEGYVKRENNISVNEYLCKPICPEEKPFEIVTTQECIKICPLQDLKMKKCILNYKNKDYIEDDIIAHDIFLKNLEIGFTSEDYNTSYIDKGEDDIYEYEKMYITLSTTKNQKNNTNKNVSTIDLESCEYLLRKEYNISDDDILYLKKIDVDEKGMKIPKVEFDVYYKFSGRNLTKLNLSVCEYSNISIYIPITTISDNLDILNSSSSYYNDICYKATSDEGTDIILKDRQKEFVENNKTVCQEDCIFSEYDAGNKKAKCSCKSKGSSSSFAYMKINKTKLYENFINIKNILNIKLMKCYKILFSIKGIFYNIASYTIISIIIFHIIVVLLFYCKQKKILIKQIKDITFNIKNFVFVEENEKWEKRKKKFYDKKKNENNNLTKKSNIKEDKNCKQNNSYKIKNLPSNNNPPTKKIFKRRLKISNSHRNTNMLSKKEDNTKSILNKEIRIKETNKKPKKIMEYDDVEKNNLSYELALEFDKRTYCEYYISLLKTKHIFMFTFFNKNDYNSRIIKIDLFFNNFAIYYFVNSLFFTDSTMHKIYESKGSFNFIDQLPQIIYSSLISFVLNMLLKLLALTERNILTYKKNQTQKNIKHKEKKLIVKLNIKFIIYFIMSFIYLLLFWYYLSIFCAVYINNQYHLIEDTLISFIISLLYPLGIYLLPGCFRIPALSKGKKGGKYLYNLSKIIQII